MARRTIDRDDLLRMINAHLESLPDCRNLRIPEVVPDPSRTYGGNWTTDGLRLSGSDHDRVACGRAIWDFMRNLQHTYDIHLDPRERALFHDEYHSGNTEKEMSDDTSNTRITRYGKYMIESRGVELDGRWVPEYRILKDGQAAVNWRQAQVSGVPSANAAIDIGIDLAIDDINTNLFESDV